MLEEYKVLKEYLAKPNEDLFEHTSKVLQCLENIKAQYKDKFTDKQWKMFYLACLYHDFGKANDLFQTKIKIKKLTIDNEINHNYISPIFLDLESLKKDFSEDEIKALVTSIYYHHDREYKPSVLQLKEYYEKYVKNYHEKINNKQKFNRLIYNYLFFKIENEMITDDLKDFTKRTNYLILKGMLNKCDGSASGNLLEIEKTSDKNIVDLIKTDLIKKKYKLKPAQQFMLDNFNNNVILIAPTGSGKTEASLLWSNGDKTFYTLPLKVASNAMYERIKNYGFDNVSLLHSDSLNTFFSENDNIESSFDKYLETKNLSYKITVSTIDQLYTFPYLALGTEKFLATLSYSKIIIDEIQMYSPQTLAAIIVGLTYVIKTNGKFAITTATFPKFILELLHQNLRKNKIQSNIVVKEFFDEINYYRHKYELKNDFDINLIKNQSKKNKVLIVVNTIDKAIELYDQLNIDNKFLLHSRFLKRDRKRLEKEIFDFSKSGKHGVWITTQIVEASLDIDFNYLYTEIAPIDSLFQRMGRCYRNKEYKKAEANIYICGEYTSKKVYDPSLINITVDTLKKEIYNNKLLSEKDKANMIDETFNLKNPKFNYYYETEKEINRLNQLSPGEIKKSEAAQRLRNITGYLVVPEEIYLNNIKLFDSFNSKLNNFEKNEILMKLEDLFVTISYDVVELRDKTPCIETNKGKVYRIRAKYDDKRGLLLKEKVNTNYI